MVAFKKLLSYLIPLIVLVLFLIFYYNPGGAFGSVKEVVSDINASIDDLIGAEEVTASKPTLPPAQKAAVDSFISTIENMKQSDKQYCFAQYGTDGFPSLGGTTISLTYDASKKSTYVKVLRGVGGMQEVLFKEIEGVRPCVIAGSEQVVEMFDKIFLDYDRENIFSAKVRSWDDKKVYLGNEEQSHFMPVSQITITYDDENIISAAHSSRIIPSEGEFQDYGMLYKPDNKHICLFPTVDGNKNCDGSDKDGLDDDCLGEDPTEDISIPQQLKTGKLVWCE